MSLNQILKIKMPEQEIAEMQKAIDKINKNFPGMTKTQFIRMGIHRYIEFVDDLHEISRKNRYTPYGSDKPMMESIMEEKERDEAAELSNYRKKKSQDKLKHKADNKETTIAIRISEEQREWLENRIKFFKKNHSSTFSLSDFIRYCIRIEIHAINSINIVDTLDPTWIKQTIVLPIDS